MNKRREHVHNRHHHRRQHEHTHHNNKDKTAHKDSRGNDNVEDGQRRYFGRNPSDAAAGHRSWQTLADLRVLECRRMEHQPKHW